MTIDSLSQGIGGGGGGLGEYISVDTRYVHRLPAGVSRM
jgi:NADPH:quinone reductase-like Zn-dependent oxidoreductase